MKSSSVIFTVAGTMLFFFTAFSCSNADENASLSSARNDLQVLIRSIHPKADILQRKDMDLKSCGRVETDPGFVESDFNGDGVKDYSMLLKIGGVKEEKEWEGKVWKLIDMWFVVFLGDELGSFKVFIIDKFETFLPSIVGISIQPPGIVRKWDSDKTVKLKYPGIQRFFCEKSASVFYWDGDKFEYVPISD